MRRSFVKQFEFYHVPCDHSGLCHLHPLSLERVTRSVANTDLFDGVLIAVVPCSMKWSNGLFVDSTNSGGKNSMNTKGHPSRIEAEDEGFDPASGGWQPISDDGFIGLVGPIWQKSDENGMRFAFLADVKHRNRRRVVHGGMIMTFADRAFGMTARHATGQKPQATIQLDVHFVSPVQIGEFVEVRPEVVRRTRSMIFMKGDLMIAARVVATANGIWKILSDG
jgi:acyl-coenzyme A thioesterase PaaI-like protein